MVAQSDIIPDTTIVSCPFSLAITKDASKKALVNLLGLAETAVLDTWTERQCIASYLVFHQVLGELNCR